MTNYEFTGETKQLGSVTLNRIKLTEDCRWGNAGYLGGWIENRENLTEDAWVYGDARVYGNARVYGGARVSGNAWVSGGEWPTSPLYIQGSNHSICTPNKQGDVKIGCHTHHIDWWLENFGKVGQREGYSEEQIREYGLHLYHVKNIINTF
jgi:hypothetical protein